MNPGLIRDVPKDLSFSDFGEKSAAQFHVATPDLQSSVTHEDSVPYSTPATSSLPEESRAHPTEFYNAFLSDQANRLMSNPIRHLLDKETPAVLSLLAGKPNSETFPIRGISLDIRSPVPPFKETTIRLSANRVDEALQYGGTPGQQSLRATLANVMYDLHGRQLDPSWRLSITAGSQDALYKVLATITNPGDVVLVEEPTYAGISSILTPMGATYEEIPVDRSGVNTAKLREQLENWPRGKPYPKFYYTIPYGCNPSGITTSQERRLEVLELSRKYKFLIVEDDPYYLLYFGSAPRPDSYFALEGKDGGSTGNVIRCDSFSKVVSSGIRFGFVTAPTPIMNKVDLLTVALSLQPPSISQSIVVTLFEFWGGTKGFLQHCQTVAAFYKSRRDMFEALLKKHMGDMIEYVSPEAGMFFWFKLKIPSKDGSAEGDSSDLILNDAWKMGVLALPGESSFATERKSAYVRASFSMLNDEDTNEALRRLAQVVKKARGEL